VVTFANWSIDGDLAVETFRFTPPEGAKRVEDSDLREAMKSPAHGLKGQAAPICVLPLLSGGQLNLAKLKGNIVVLDFWATWCPPCRKGLPILDEIASEYKDKGVQVYAINCNEAPAQVRQFVTSTNLQLPVAMDAGKTVGGRYSVQGIPQTVIIDKDGIVRCVHVGLPGNAKQAFMKTLDALLAGQDIAPDASQGDGEAVTSPGEQ
jgi:thiol-disulfide isomerase/thioredoxin